MSLNLAIHETDLSGEFFGLRLGSGHALVDDAVDDLPRSLGGALAVLGEGEAGDQTLLLGHGVTVSHHLLGEALELPPAGVVLIPL